MLFHACYPLNTITPLSWKLLSGRFDRHCKSSQRTLFRAHNSTPSKTSPHVRSTISFFKSCWLLLELGFPGACFGSWPPAAPVPGTGHATQSGACSRCCWCPARISSAAALPQELWVSAPPTPHYRQPPVPCPWSGQLCRLMDVVTKGPQ